MGTLLKTLILCVGLLSASSSIIAEQIKPVIDIPYVYTQDNRVGWEERGAEVDKWLIPTVRIGGGSGTIVYYDGQQNYAYVLSCGHLFPRGRSSSKQESKQVYLEVFYHGTTKLKSVQKYVGEVLCHVWGDDSSAVYDCSLIRFKPDWQDIVCAPIAPMDFNYTVRTWFHSTGCDNRSATAHYLVECVREQNNGNVTEILTRNNAPRGGRSGGGLFSENGELIGVCSRSGNDIGYWTSLKQIPRFLKEEGYAFILDSQLAKKIPIVDRNNPQGKYPKDYVLVPGRGI